MANFPSVWFIIRHPLVTRVGKHPTRVYQLHPRPIKMYVEHGSNRKQACAVVRYMEYPLLMERWEAAAQLRAARRTATQQPALLRLR